MEAKEGERGCKGLGRNKQNPELCIYTPAEGQQADQTKRQVKFLHSMPLPNRSLEICTHRHMSAVRSLTAYHATHYRTISFPA
jgi:hypothetical protein